MANQILIKRGTGTSALANGELGYNTSTNTLYIGNNGNKAIGGSGAFLPLSGGTMTGTLTAPYIKIYSASWPSLSFGPDANTGTGSIYQAINSHRIGINQFAAGSDYSENYLLPTPNVLEKDNVWYNILTTKNTITVAQGGTGKTTLTSGQALIGNGTGAITTRAIVHNTNVGSLGWSNNSNALTTLSTLAYWDGAFTGNSSNLSKLATVTSGTWQATAIAIAYGGTGATTASGACTNLGAVKKSGDAMTGQLSTTRMVVAAEWPTYAFYHSTSSREYAFIQTGTDGSFAFYTYGNGESKWTGYALPGPDTGLTANKKYNILTTKSTVTIGQGGTGATTADGACTNLGAVKKSGDTMTGCLWANGGFAIKGNYSINILSDQAQGYYLKNSAGNTIVGGMKIDPTTNQVSLSQKMVNQNAYEIYYLPAPASLTSGKNYTILTTKNAGNGLNSYLTEGGGISETIDVFTLAPGVYHLENTSSTDKNYPIAESRATVFVYGQFRAGTAATDGYPNGYWVIRVLYGSGKEYINYRYWSAWKGWKQVHNAFNTITVAQGGTGKTTFTSGQALIGNGTGAIATRAITDNTSVGALISSSSWTSNNSNLVTLNTLAFWNGAHAGNYSNLSKLATVTTGTWQATAIAVAYGGTGATSASGACTNLGAVKKSGDAMTGQLSISHNSFHTLKLIASSSNTSKEASIGFFQNTTETWTMGVATGSNGTTDFGLYASNRGLVYKIGLDGDFYTYRMVTGKTMTNSWIKFSHEAPFRVSAVNVGAGATPVISAKTPKGAWGIGSYDNERLFFTYGSDTNYSNNTNTTKQISFDETGKIYADVYSGNGIRYSTSQPSNGVAGQIWLKPI